MKKALAIIAAALLVGSLLTVQSAFAAQKQYHMKDTTESADKTLSQSVSIIVPLYIAPGIGGSYPSADWDTLMDTADAYPKATFYAIINPASGPGYAQNWPNSGWQQDYTQGISDLTAKGIYVLGYIYSDYGDRSLNDVYADIDDYEDWYQGSGLKGIFIDEMNYDDDTKASYYASITNYAKSHGFTMTIGNPGTDSIPEFIGTVDKIMITEGAGMPTQSELEGANDWHLSYDKSNFGYYAYNMTSFSATAVADTFDYVSTFYLTTDTYPPNPWDTLSTYIDEMADVLEDQVPTGDDELRSGLFEYATASSALEGDTIDTIKLKLKRTGSPAGNYVVGVFNGTDGSVKQVFAEKSASSLPTTFTEMTFDNSVAYMDVTSDNASWALHSGGTTIWAEYVANTSSDLYGKTIDTIKATLSRTGSPPGQITFGVWNGAGSLVHTFGTVTAMAVSTSQMDVVARGSSYTLQSGDRIGVSYSGGDASNYIRGYDNNANPFDGTDSYRHRWDSTTSSWVTTATGNDVRATFIEHPDMPYTVQEGDYVGIYYNKGDASNYISVKVDTDASDPFDGSNSVYAERTHRLLTNSTRDVTMSLTKTGNPYEDTIATFSTALNDVNKSSAERITSTATDLIGEKVNEITVRLKKTGSPTGTVYIGVLDSSNNITTQFGTIDASTVSTSATDYTFTLSGPTTYTIASGDRIGVKYTSGTSSNYIEVYRDQDGNAAPFGTDAYREYYTTSWQVFNGNDYNQDLYMVMRLTGQYAPTLSFFVYFFSSQDRCMRIMRSFPTTLFVNFV